MPKNPSDKQREASRRNGARSRGPQTPDGRLMSSLGPFKHGKYAKFAAVMRAEDSDEFIAYRDSLVRRFQPADDVEMYLVTALASCDWRLERFVFAETRALDNETLGHLNSPLVRQQEIFVGDRATLAIESLVGRSGLLQFLGQQQTRIINQRASLQRQLLRIQATRPSSLPPLLQFEPYPIDPELARAASCNEPRASASGGVSVFDLGRQPEAAPQTIDFTRITPVSPSSKEPEPPIRLPFDHGPERHVA